MISWIDVIIDNTPLNDAPNFCYLGNILSYKVQLDEEITQRLSKAGSAFGERSWYLSGHKDLRLSISSSHLSLRWLRDMDILLALY